MPPLVLTSSSIPADTADTPRNDARSVAIALGAGILEPVETNGIGARVGRALRMDVAQARHAKAKQPSAYLSWSERVSVPLAALDRGTPHATFMHAIESGLKRRVIALSGLSRRAGAVGVFSAAQQRLAIDALGIDPDRVSIVPYTVDEQFFAPREDDEAQEYVLAVGREQRDWPTLASAVKRAGVRCVVVGSSPWSRRAASGIDDPAFERRHRLSYPELRDLYAGARLVVLPLLADVRYAAGLTTLREAQAMGRPVLYSDVPGLDGLAGPGRAVAAGNPAALAAAITTALKDESGSRELGEEGLAYAREHTFEKYVRHMADMVGSA